MKTLLIFAALTATEAPQLTVPECQAVTDQATVYQGKCPTTPLRRPMTEGRKPLEHGDFGPKEYIPFYEWYWTEETMPLPKNMIFYPKE